MNAGLINARFRTTPGWRSGHLQTIRSRVVRPRYDIGRYGSTRSLLIETSDDTGDRLYTDIHLSHRRPDPAVAGALVLLVHGLGGSSESSYVQASTLGLLAAGFNVARLDLRGVGKSAATSSQLYHGGRTQDLRDVTRALANEPEASRNQHGVPRVAIVGFSLGGNMTLKMLGEPRHDLPLIAGVSVSAPLDLVTGSVFLRRAGLGIYERALVRSLKAQASIPLPDGAGRLSSSELRELTHARTLADFDDVVTAPRNGWRDAAQYYAVNSSNQFLPSVDVPTLMIHSVDDPMIPTLPYQVVDWQQLARRGFVERRITPRGGHVGFHEANNSLPWFVGQTVAFLSQH